MNTKHLALHLLVGAALWAAFFATVVRAAPVVELPTVYIDAAGAAFVPDAATDGGTLVAAPAAVQAKVTADIAAPSVDAAAAAVSEATNTPAPVVKFGAIAGIVLAVLGIAKTILKSAGASSVWSKAPVPVRAGIMIGLAAVTAGLTAYTSGQGIWAAAGAMVMGGLAVFQHGDDLAPPSAAA